MSSTDHADDDKGKKAAAAVAAAATIAAVAGQLLHEDATGADAATKAGHDPFDDLVPPPVVARAEAAPGDTDADTDTGEAPGATLPSPPAAPTAAEAVGAVATPMEVTAPADPTGVGPGDVQATGAAAATLATEPPDAALEPTSSTDPLEDVMTPSPVDAPPTAEAPTEPVVVNEPVTEAVEVAEPLEQDPLPSVDPIATPLPQGLDGADVVWVDPAPSGVMGPSGATSGAGGGGPAGDAGPVVTGGAGGRGGAVGAAGGVGDAGPVGSGEAGTPGYVAPTPIVVGEPNPMLVADPVMTDTPTPDEVTGDAFAERRIAAMEAAANAAEHNAAQQQSQADQQAFAASQAQALAAQALQQQQQEYAASLLERAVELLREQSIAAFASMGAQSFDLDDKIELWQEIKALNPSLTGGPQQLAPFISSNATMEQIAAHFGVDVAALADAVALEDNPQFTIADIVESRSLGTIDISADVIVVNVDGVDVLLNADQTVEFDSGPEGSFESMELTSLHMPTDHLEGFAGLYHVPD